MVKGAAPGPFPEMMTGGELENSLYAKRRPWTVSFIGAGGKTSLLKALALFARSKGMGVLAATTAHVRASEFFGPPFVPMLLGEATPDALDHLRCAGMIPFVHGGIETEKLRGIPPEEVRRVGRGFEAVLVESDGGKGMPLKRLRDHEPPLPQGGKVVLVVGADAAGRPLEEACFNWEGAVNQGIARPGQVLDAASIRHILYEPRGYLDVAGNRPMFLAVNKGDIGANAEALARELYHPRLAEVFVTSVKRGGAKSVHITNRGKRIAAVVLAAGESRRFGRPKQSAQMGRTTVLGRVLSNILGARGLEKVVVVLGHRHKEVVASLGRTAQSPRLCFIVNDDYRLGMSTSLRAGVRIAGTCYAAAVFLGDQPFIDPTAINTVLEAYLSRPCRLAYPVAGGRRGHPVVLGRELFSELESLEGDTGARAVVEKNAGWAAEAAISPRTQRDIDHQKDLKRPCHGRPR
jgi:molybdenum cofactor cytidylyltransferase